MAGIEQARKLQQALTRDDGTAERILAALESKGASAEYNALARENAAQQRKIEQLEAAVGRLQKQPPMVEAIDKRFDRTEGGIDRMMSKLMAKDTDLSPVLKEIAGLSGVMHKQIETLMKIKLPEVPAFPEFPDMPNHEPVLSSIVATLDQLHAAVGALSTTEVEEPPVLSWSFDFKRKGNMGLVDKVIATPKRESH